MFIKSRDLDRFWSGDLLLAMALARWAVEQNVVQSLSARASRFDGDSQVFLDFGLADELGEALWAKFQLKRRVVFDRRGGNETLQIRNVFGGGH